MIRYSSGGELVWSTRGTKEVGVDAIIRVLFAFLECLIDKKSRCPPQTDNVTNELSAANLYRASVERLGL